MILVILLLKRENGYIGTLHPDGNIAENFKRWKRKFELCICWLDKVVKKTPEDQLQFSIQFSIHSTQFFTGKCNMHHFESGFSNKLSYAKRWDVSYFESEIFKNY